MQPVAWRVILANTWEVKRSMVLPSSTGCPDTHLWIYLALWPRWVTSPEVCKWADWT